ncbi:MAG TPA: PIN domain-containing protein [Thermoanaerobaculia bacterium]|nr:PIN domain-containing protein [Thermoanaerobaculia bacterium]
MIARLFVDSNVLVYAFDESEPAKQHLAQRLISSHGTEHKLVLSTQVLQEFYVNVTRKLKRPVPGPVALAAVERFASLQVKQITPATVLLAIRRHQAEQLAFWDALILEAALAARCQRLASEDFQHGRRYGDLVIENPFLI